MKVFIWKDEFYPHYGITYPFSRERRHTIKIPVELYNRYKEVKKEYDKVQEELAKYPYEDEYIDMCPEDPGLVFRRKEN